MLNKRRQQLNTRGTAMMRARVKAGMSRDELAEIAGVSRSTIGKWECDVNVPSVDVLELVADALGLSIDEYVGHEVVQHG